MVCVWDMHLGDSRGRGAGVCLGVWRHARVASGCVRGRKDIGPDRISAGRRSGKRIGACAPAR